MTFTRLLILFAWYGFALSPLPSIAAPAEFRFGVIAQPFADPARDEPALRQMLDDTDADNLAFVLVNGIKSFAEPCSDEIYEQRKALLDNAKNGVIVSVAASDWSECRYSDGRIAALERLNRIRDLYFSTDLSFGASKLPLTRQSSNAKFRDYSENSRWELNGITFATINLPANNNRYIAAAGRNGEFEDRQIANQDWINRLVTFAKRSKSIGIVIFCDGNPLAETSAAGKRDGFAEIRQVLHAAASKFPGKILVIHNRPRNAKTEERIVWRGNIGELGLRSGWTRLAVVPASLSLFSIVERNGDTGNGARNKKAAPNVAALSAN